MFVWHVPEGQAQTWEDDFITIIEPQEFQMGDNTGQEPMNTTTPYMFYWTGFEDMNIPP